MSDRCDCRINHRYGHIGSAASIELPLHQDSRRASHQQTGTATTQQTTSTTALLFNHFIGLEPI